MARKGPAAPARARAAVVMNRPAGCQSLCGRGGTRQTHKVESLAVNSHGGSIPPDRTKIRRDGGTGRRTGLRTQHPVRGIGVQIPFPVPRQAAKRIRRCQLPPRKNRLQACGSVVMAAEHGSEPCGRDTVRVRLPPSAPRLRPCRNWQTGGPQKPVWDTTWRFDASRPHQVQAGRGTLVTPRRPRARPWPADDAASPMRREMALHTGSVSKHSPQWRNRQTHTAQTRAPSKAWGSDSPLRHQDITGCTIFGHAGCNSLRRGGRAA